MTINRKEFIKNTLVLGTAGVVPISNISIMEQHFSSDFVKKSQLAQIPPMGFMSWNYFSTDVNAKALKEVADSMVALGMVEAGYKYLCIDDGWQGGRG